DLTINQDASPTNVEDGSGFLGSVWGYPGTAWRKVRRLCVAEMLQPDQVHPGRRSRDRRYGIRFGSDSATPRMRVFNDVSLGALPKVAAKNSNSKEGGGGGGRQGSGSSGAEE
ncbi:hypothetical protein V5O48_012507, partial [Marasmius crinis-equi]